MSGGIEHHLSRIANALEGKRPPLGVMFPNHITVGVGNLLAERDQLIQRLQTLESEHRRNLLLLGRIRRAVDRDEPIEHLQTLLMGTHFGGAEPGGPDDR